MDATSKETLNLEFPCDFEFKSFENLIYLRSFRNILQKNDKINLSNFNKFIFDFDKIENDLGFIFLPGKRLFFDVETLRTVVYRFEGLQGSDVLLKLITTYEQKPLKLESKQKLYDYYYAKIKENNKYNFTDFFFDIQNIINKLTEIRFPIETSINDIIESETNVKALNFNKDFKEFFSENSEYDISCILDLMSFFEYLCFDSIKDQIAPDFRLEIPDEERRKVDKYFSTLDTQKKDYERNKERELKRLKEQKEKEKKEGINQQQMDNSVLFGKQEVKEPIRLFFNQQQFATAIRKLISRSIAGSSQVADIKPNANLGLYLTRDDLWPPGLDLDIIRLEVEKFLGNIPITVAMAFDLYNLLGGDNDVFLEGIKTNDDVEVPEEGKGGQGEKGEQGGANANKNKAKNTAKKTNAKGQKPKKKT